VEWLVINDLLVLLSINLNELDAGCLLQAKVLVEPLESGESLFLLLSFH